MSDQATERPAASPLVRRVLALTKASPDKQEWLLREARLGPNFCTNLKKGHSPMLRNLEALVDLLGYEIVIREKGALTRTGVPAVEADRISGALAVIREALHGTSDHDA